MVQNYIQEKPNFDDLADLREEVKSILSLITALAEENDTIQRATDLMIAVENLREKAEDLLTIYENEDDTLYHIYENEDNDALC